MVVRVTQQESSENTFPHRHGKRDPPRVLTVREHSATQWTWSGFTLFTKRDPSRVPIAPKSSHAGEASKDIRASTQGGNRSRAPIVPRNSALKVILKYICASTQESNPSRVLIAVEASTTGQISEYINAFIQERDPSRVLIAPEGSYNGVI